MADELASPGERCATVAAEARSAESRGDDLTAADAWRRYRLIRDAQRDPEDLLVEGIELSTMALALRAQ